MAGRRFARPVNLCLVCVLLQLVEIAEAADADDPVYLVEYRAYRQASKAGDTDGAIRHARAAWQSSEQLLRDDQTTAILAFNFGRLQLYRDAGAALPALRRADALQQSGVADLPSAELRLFLAYAAYQTSRQRWGDLKDFRKALKASTQELSDGSIDLANIWISLTTEDFAARRYSYAIESAASTEAVIRAAVPDDLAALAQVILIGGAARIIPANRTEGQILAAHREFRRARRLFPPQKDIASFDPLLAEILAWDAAAEAAYRTRNSKGLPADSTEGAAPMPPIFESNSSSEERCGEIEWSNRKPPEYPEEARIAGYIGAVIVGYNLGDDLRVSDPKILAEVPAQKFGNAAVSAIADWQAAPLASEDPVCRRNLLTRFTFVLD